MNYRDLKGELAKQGITFVDYIFILNDTDGHWDAVSELIAPQGHICSIVENAHPLNRQAEIQIRRPALGIHVYPQHVPDCRYGASG